VVEGLRRLQASVALLGGETAEMPGFLCPGRYDLAALCVAVVEAERRLIERERQVEAVDASSAWPARGAIANWLFRTGAPAFLDARAGINGPAPSTAVTSR